MLCKRFADCIAFFYFGKILGFDFSAFQRNAQPSPQVMISGVWGYVTNKHFGRNTGNGFLPKYAILRKIALLAKKLLVTGTPLTTIAQILGHDDLKSSRQYLSLDTGNLKECALDFRVIPLERRELL